MEDPAKVQEVLKELNGTGKTGPWIEVKGTNIMPMLKLDPFGNYKVDPNTGYSVKLFVNIRNGEIKPYASLRVEKE